MLIGELSKQTGLSKDTIRFYEKLGLISAVSNDVSTKSYKKYSLETIERLSTIIQGKGLGFTLSEIKQLLDEWGGGEISKRDLIEIVERKIEEVIKKKQQLESIEIYLVNKLSKLNAEISSDKLASSSVLQSVPQPV
jgi:MerR family transcriptional regulator, copper efflux regulator